MPHSVPCRQQVRKERSLKTKLLFLACVLLAATACDPRAISAGMTKPDRVEFVQDGVVCYTYSTAISCVRVRP